MDNIIKINFWENREKIALKKHKKIIEIANDLILEGSAFLYEAEMNEMDESQFEEVINDLEDAIKTYKKHKKSLTKLKKLDIL